MYFGKADIGAECNGKYCDCSLSDLRNSLLAVCKGAGVEMTEASIVNHIICTIKTLYLQEKSRFGY
jgi:hypothetical protein